MGGALLEGGGVVLVGANGVVLTRAGADAPFVASTFRNRDRREPRCCPASLPAGNGAFIVIGDKGVDFHQAQ